MSMWHEYNREKIAKSIHKADSFISKQQNLNHDFIMVKIKNVMLITVIGIVVLLSGCTGNQEKNIIETAQSTPVQSPPVQTTAVQSNGAQTPAVPYQVQVTEVKNLQACIVEAGTTPCLLFNLNVKNNEVKPLRFQIVKNELISDGGKKLGDRYDKNVGLRPMKHFNYSKNIWLS
jgi:hypothetical protein